MKKYQIEEYIWKQALQLMPEYWEKLDNQTKKEIVEGFASRIHEDSLEFDSILSSIRSRKEDANFFIYGVVVGISGGFISDALSKLFDKSGILGI